MIQEITTIIEKLPKEIQELFESLRSIIMSIESVEEKVWARMPTYSVKENFIRLIPFKDHINIEANAMKSHEEELKSLGFELTPKGFLKINPKQIIPKEELLKIFSETLTM